MPSCWPPTKSRAPLKTSCGSGGGGWCLNVNLVIGFGPSLNLALWPRAKPINSAPLTVEWYRCQLNRVKI